MTRGDDATVAGTAPDSAENAIASADLVGGRYRIVRWLGGGGMGRVYEALDSELDVRVALKVLHLSTSDEALERFRNEVRLTRQIQHRNIARMFDIGVHEGHRFLTMEMVDGDPLGREMGHGPLPWARLAPIAEQLCAGLAAAHAAGIVHRDLKPDNVLVERGTGRIAITDFGIARRNVDPGITQLGTVVGTPRYMAPEQLAGREVDARADLFALGVILYELATEQRPWTGDNPIAIAVAQATEPPAPLTARDLPAAVAAMIMRCIAIEPVDRPATAGEIGASIAAAWDPTPQAIAQVPPMRVSGVSPSMVANAAAGAATPRAAAKEASIAVLPFSCAPDDAYLAEGVFEDLIDTLSTTSRIRVRPAGTVLAASAGVPDPQEVGKKLEVDQIVTGSLRRLPTGVRVTARLLGVADGFQIWSQKTDCTEAEVLVVSQHLARGIASALSTRSTVATRPTDPRAVDLFLRARAELRRFWGAPTRNASNLLGEAYELAPSSPQIAGAYAYAAVQAWVMNGDPALLGRAETAVGQGLATGHGDAFLASAQLRMNQGDLVGGAGDLGTALLLAPMSGQAHEAAARILLEITGFDAASRHFETARGLEPGRGKVIDSELARLDALSGDYASAQRRIEELAGDGNPAIAQLGEIFEVRFAAWRGDAAGALAATSRIVAGLSTQAERMIGFIRDSLAKRAIDEAAWNRVVSMQYGRDRPTRLRVLGLQLLGETGILLGAEPLALSAFEQASQLGLIDINWIDRCPLFIRVVDRSRWSRLRAEVASRAAAVLAAFEAAGASR